MSDMQKEIYEALSLLCGGQVADLFTSYLGLQILDDGFRWFLVEEGILPELEKEDDKQDGLSISDTDDIEEICKSWSSCFKCPVYKVKNIKESCDEAFYKLKAKEEQGGQDTADE